MAPSKQSERKAQKRASKVDDEPAAPAATGPNAIINVAAQLFLGSVLVELSPVLPKLMKADTAAAPTNGSEDKKDEGDEGKTEDASSIFESLTKRLSFSNVLGLDKAPEVSWELFISLEPDGGPIKRKRGNPKLERIMVNVERNMSPYVLILLALMCLHALTFRSWFACLPWLVGYQMLSLHLPMDVIKETFPQVPPIESKYRVAITLGIHALLWLFFLVEVVYQINFLWKILFIILFSAHAYVMKPDENPDAKRKEITEKLAKQSADAPPVETGKIDTTGFKKTVAISKELITGSVLAKEGRQIPDLVKEIVSAQPGKQVDGDKLFESIKKDYITIFSPLGLGTSVNLDTWMQLKKVKLDLSFNKTGSGIAERISLSLSKNLPVYLPLTLYFMCLRSFFFRSYFACLPWLCFYQFLFLNLPVDKIKEKLPQVPPVAIEAKTLAVLVMMLNAFMDLFFVFEVVICTGIFEKIVLLGGLAAHALVLVPVPEEKKSN